MRRALGGAVELDALKRAVEVRDDVRVGSGEGVNPHHVGR
jgi:hypothetical protein